MADFSWWLVDLSLLLAAYWGVDWAVRQGGLLRALAALRLAQPIRWTLLWTLAGAVAAPCWSWRSLAEGPVLRLVGGSLCIALAWRAATRDVDVVNPEDALWPRLCLVLCAFGALLSPALLISAVVLASTPFGMWQHHATMPMRVLQALVAHALLSLALPKASTTVGAAAFVSLAVTIQISHYLITALAKGYLGPHWYSWMIDNRLHHIAASAYSWGWGRFVPWDRWRHLVRGVARIERPLQVLVFALELLSPLALLHPDAAVSFGVAWAGFHLGVFALSGLLFWEWILTDLLLAVAVAGLSPATTTLAFGTLPLLVCLAVLATFPLRHRLWKPMPLGWWDTPFTQRMHWIVQGDSGARYGLYAHTMDPHERIYGKVHGCFMAPVPVLTYHLGEAWRHELRDGLRASGGDPARIDALRETFGVSPRSTSLTRNHEAYLQRFCWELNHGAHKAVLPRALRWLKAPGGQCFYWGELPAYKRQEPIASVEVVYREEFFDGERLLRVRDQRVLQLTVERGERPPPPACEPTPKQLDDHLLGFAAGRLIRLPGVGGGYVRGDDGQPPPLPTSDPLTS